MIESIDFPRPYVCVCSSATAETATDNAGDEQQQQQQQQDTSDRAAGGCPLSSIREKGLIKLILEFAQPRLVQNNRYGDENGGADGEADDVETASGPWTVF